ncbi:MAG: hypothetical protein LUC91_00080, partial [Prevotella sp.]|nr:hypothetical protein [Prevotella sp.]
YNVIEEVNAALKNEQQLSACYTIGAAMGVMEKMDEFDMESEYRMKRYNPNRSTLSGISNNFLRSLESTYHTTPTTSRPYSSTSSSSSSGGCYIATMVYGNYSHPQVMVLRNFRDEYLAKRGWGRKFIKFYYKYSPRLVEKLKDHKGINLMIKGILDKFIIFLKSKKLD